MTLYSSTFPLQTTSPTFSVEPTATVVAQSGHVGVLVNISLPRYTSAECTVCTLHLCIYDNFANFANLASMNSCLDIFSLFH